MLMKRSIGRTLMMDSARNLPNNNLMHEFFGEKSKLKEKIKNYNRKQINSRHNIMRKR